MKRRTQRIAWWITVSGALTLAAPIAALAQQSPLDAARAACASDLQQFCAGVQSGGGRLLACLKEHRDQVSPGCKQAVRAALQGPGGGAATPGEAAPIAPAPAPVTPPSTSNQAPAAAPTTAHRVARAESGAARFYRLKLDKAQSQDPSHPMTIYTLLAPTDWALEGGFINNKDAGSCFSDFIQLNGAVKNSDSTYGMAVVPQSSYRYADDPAVRQQMEQRDRQDEQFHLKGCPIVAPMHAADYIREHLIWKFHKDKPQVTAEPFPELEQLVRQRLGLPAPGRGTGDGATRVEAARVRVATTNNQGAAVDEWWSAAIVVHLVPVGGRGVAYDWHAEQTTVLQTPRGKIDGYDKLYRVMATSLRVDPQFQAWSGGMISKLYAARAQAIQQQNAMIAAFQQHVAETIQGVTANAQRGAIQAAHGEDQLVRGVQTFRDPSTGRTVELSNLYDHAWANGNDQYIVTDDSNFNPNGQVTGNWGQLQLVQPQP
jgi:Cysteine rich repeat